MIENNPTNVQAAFEMLLEEIEAEIDFINGGSARKPSRRGTMIEPERSLSMPAS